MTLRPTSYGDPRHIGTALLPPSLRVAPADGPHHCTAGRGAHCVLAGATPRGDLIGHPLDTSGAPSRALPSRAARDPDEAALSSRGLLVTPGVSAPDLPPAQTSIEPALTTGGGRNERI
jgi:hypothetical protein